MFAEFHGSSVTTTAIDPIKIQEYAKSHCLLLFYCFYRFCRFTPTATISDPINENITTVIPSTELIPFGINPPCPIKFEVPGASVPGTNPKITARPRQRNKTILITLIKENQYSNSPNDFTEKRSSALIKLLILNLITKAVFVESNIDNTSTCCGFYCNNNYPKPV